MTRAPHPISTIFIDTDCLIDRQRLAQMLPDAFASTLSDRFGLEAGRWREAYRAVQADWDSYWADLTLSEDDSVAQWREGRWRIVRALFRLVDLPLPEVEQMPLFLDDLPRAQGRLCPVWCEGAIQALGRILQDAACVLLSPYQPSGLISGMLDGAHFAGDVRVLGPDELEQVGLEGLDSRVLLIRANAEADSAVLVSHTEIEGIQQVRPPANLTELPSIVLRK